MTRSAVNFLVDALLLASLLCLLGSGGVLMFVFPVPARSTGWLVFGWSHTAWFRLHLAILGEFALMVLLHLILHWTWVCGFITARLARRGERPRVLPDGVRTLYGVCVLIAGLVMLCTFWAWATFSAKPPIGMGPG